MSPPRTYHTAVIGAGIAGIATAYFLKKLAPRATILLLDSAQPMGFTSAQSGENYRNWWPHPLITRFMDRSIDLMEEMALAAQGDLVMSRRGYVLATRKANAEQFLDELHAGYEGSPHSRIRVHNGASSGTYVPAAGADWRRAQDGVDVLQNQTLIRQMFPAFDPELRLVVHIRRGGAIDSAQFGHHMLSAFAGMGGERRTAQVIAIEKDAGFRLQLEGAEQPVRAETMVNAAGPFAPHIAQMLGVSLPVHNIVQQKLAFEDTAGAVERTLPFAIDLDDQTLDWTTEERELLAADPGMAWLAKPMPGAIHCRPDGGDGGSWVKLGWAYNQTQSEPVLTPPLDDAFPEIVLRGAARLQPALKRYYGQLPRARRHYGGYYTMTEENWPLIGPMGVDGAFIVSALSGFGTMAACAAGELAARWVHGLDLPEYAGPLSLARYQDAELMTALAKQRSRGIL